MTTSDVENSDVKHVDPLKLEVNVDEPSACQRHVTVTIERDDIDRYFDEAVRGLDAGSGGARVSSGSSAAETGGEPLQER